MRKIIKTNFGMEVIFAQETWMTASFLEIGTGKETEYKTAPFDITYYIEDGMARFTLNGRDYEFGTGKTVTIRKGTKYRIKTMSVSKLIKITNYIYKDRDFTQV